MLTPSRIYEEELLDAGAGTDEDVAANLADLRRINRFLGGTRVVLDALAHTIEPGTGRLSLIDVGTGSADIPTAVSEWCIVKGIDAAITGLDISERNLRITRTMLGVAPDVHLVRADALELPLADRSVDCVTASLFLHHFREEDVVRLLMGFARVARRVVIVNDLERNLLPYWAIRVAAPLLAKSFLTRNDGPVSVLRGFTVTELCDLATRAHLKSFTIRRLFPYRIALVADVSE